MNNAYEMLSSVRLTRVVQSLQYVQDLPQELYFLSKHPVVPATDAEILARFVGRAQIADIIAPDAQAVVYQFGRWQTETLNIPKIKFGFNLTEQQIDQLDTLMGQGGPATGMDSPLERFYRTIGQALVLGIRQRWESLLIAAYVDAFSYDRLGIKLSGVKFGTPAELKVTPATSWDQVSADPVTDILQTKLVARQRFGINYNRMIISQTAFLYMISTTAFINRVRTLWSINATASLQLGLQSLQDWQKLAAPALGLDEIVFYDARYWTQDTTGAETSVRFLPVQNVILSSTMNDNKDGVMELRNAVPAESKVAGMVPSNAIGDLPRGQYGPIAYATPANPNLNPPGITMWGAAKSWPWKIQQQMNAVLTVGTFTDTIPTNMVFPVP